MTGLAVVCGTDGTVLRVVADSLDGASLRASLCDSVDASSAEACAIFLRAVVRSRFARSLPLRIGTRDVHAFGICRDQEIRIVAVVDPATAAELSEHAGFDTLAEEIRRTHSTYELYEELARVNNDLVTAQRELARTIGELQRLNAYKDELLGMAAHDLRNPLNANAAYVSFLLSDTRGLSEDQLVLLDRLRTNSSYMLRLVESVLDFSAIQAGHVRLELEDVELAEAAGEVVETMRILADAKDITIDFTARPVAAMRLDRVKIMEALQNLISNAVQYSPPRHAVQVRVGEQDGVVQLEVEDHGPGIAPEDLPHLFKPFVRLATAKHARQRSVGLGLAITRRLVEAHGGTMDVRSTVGKGSTFTIRLRR